MDNPSKLPNLETSLSEIADLINKMENGELSLEHSLSHFERGVKLVKHCQKILQEAEQKVQQLMQSNNQEMLLAYGGETDKGIELNEHSTE